MRCSCALSFNEMIPRYLFIVRLFSSLSYALSIMKSLWWQWRLIQNENFFKWLKPKKRFHDRSRSPDFGYLPTLASLSIEEISGYTTCTFSHRVWFHLPLSSGVREYKENRISVSCAVAYRNLTNHFLTLLICIEWWKIRYLLLSLILFLGFHAVVNVRHWNFSALSSNSYNIVVWVRRMNIVFGLFDKF